MWNSPENDECTFNIPHPALLLCGILIGRVCVGRNGIEKCYLRGEIGLKRFSNLCITWASGFEHFVGIIGCYIPYELWFQNLGSVYIILF